MSTQLPRDSDWQRLSTVDATLTDYVRSVFVDGVAIGVELGYGRLYAIRLKEDVANTLRYGAGGGFVGEAEMSRARLDSFIKKTVPADPDVRRGPIQEVWPLG